MGPVSATITVDAPRQRVFDLLRDLANRPAFCDPVLEDFHLQRLESAGVGAAARFRLRRPRMWMETVIEVLEPPYLVSESGRAGRLGRIPVFTAWELVDAAGPGGCTVTVTFWSEPTHPADRLRARLVSERRQRRAWGRALHALKDLIENERPVRRAAVAGADRVPAVA